MSEELKPCPFCGRAAVIVMNTAGQYCAQCTNFMCDAVIITETYEDAMNRWNRRNSGQNDDT